MDTSTPGARIDKWRSQLRGAWLIISIAGTPVHTFEEAQTAFASLSCTLLFSHPEISPDISNRGVPIMSRSNFTNFSQYTHDQLNSLRSILVRVGTENSLSFSFRT
jgi:hypothetical protein